ncbi:hypothetical protein BCON_0006g00590 [Botryotinia convoluta]|uniref:Uncharacterized protein n=1 Tax=Botryotinia convoluta TaxID=54673 RepID=A0A4Z1J711_9HELO|nr:hypothetical protein BCON_0006g00590 [Botryotinia convoluta]
MTYKKQFWHNAGVHKYLLPRHLILSYILYVNVTPHPPPILNPAVCNIIGATISRSPTGQSRHIRIPNSWCAHAQFNHSTLRREYGKTKSVDSGWRNAKRPTRNTFASADWKEGNGENLNKGNEDHISGEDINTSRDYKKDEIVELLPEAKIILSYRENSEFANESPSGKIIYKHACQWDTCPETNVTIRRYEIFGDSPQIRKAGLVRRAGRIEAAQEIDQSNYISPNSTTRSPDYINRSNPRNPTNSSDVSQEKIGKRKKQKQNSE